MQAMTQQPLLVKSLNGRYSILQSSCNHIKTICISTYQLSPKTCISENQLNREQVTFNISNSPSTTITHKSQSTPLEPSIFRELMDILNGKLESYTSY